MTRGPVIRDMAVHDIAVAIDRAAAILRDPLSEEGARARSELPEVTGYSKEVIEDILQHMCDDWSLPSLQRLLESELGNAEPQGPELILHIFSGNVPGVAVTSLIRALLVKSKSVGKLASGEPLLPQLFLSALQKVSPELAGTIELRYWKGGDEAIEAELFEKADIIVVYGGADTVASIQKRAPKEKLRIHGPKISFGIVGPNPERSVAKDIARAVASYDQQGCVSPHLVYAMTNAKELAEEIAAELAQLAKKYPRRIVDPAEAMAIREARTKAEFKEIGGGDVAVFGSADTSFTVIYDADPRFEPSCLNRTLYVYHVHNIDQIFGLIQPYRDFLQSVGLAGFDDSETIAELLVRCGVTRISSFSDLPWPAMNWLHDGRGPLTELLI